MDPGNAPLYVCFGIAMGVTLVAAVLRRRGWLPCSMFLLGAVGAAATQAAIRSEDLPIVMAGIGMIFGSATVVTRGDPFRFFDGDSSQEASGRSARIQAITLLIAAIPFAILVVLYRDRFQ